MSEGLDPLQAIARLLDESGDADDGLRAVVDALVRDHGCDWAGILFSEDGALVLGPQAGSPRPEARVQLPVDYDGARVAEIVADGCPDDALLRSVADVISPYCLVGWDTGGVPWDPAA